MVGPAISFYLNRSHFSLDQISVMVSYGWEGISNNFLPGWFLEKGGYGEQDSKMFRFFNLAGGIQWKVHLMVNFLCCHSQNTLEIGHFQNPRHRELWSWLVCGNIIESMQHFKPLQDSLKYPRKRKFCRHPHLPNHSFTEHRS